MIKVDHEVPVAAWVADLILAKKPTLIPGAFPYSDMEARDYLQPLWWAVEMAITPFEDFLTRIPMLFNLAVEKWTSANSSQVTDWATWQTKLPKKADSQKRESTANDGGSPGKKRKTKAERKAAWRDGGDTTQLTDGADAHRGTDNAGALDGAAGQGVQGAYNMGAIR